MRFSPAALALSLALATVSSAGYSQTADVDIKARSVQYMAMGEKAQQSGDLGLASDLYETALAVDPRNGSAFIALAQIAQAQKLPGKAIRFYREALILNPNNIDALSGQGEAMVQRGAVEKAKTNLSRIETLCRTKCPQTARLEAAIDKAPTEPVMSAQAVTPKPTVGDEEPETETP